MEVDIQKEGRTVDCQSAVDFPAMSISRQTVFFLCLTALLTACGERSAQKPAAPSVPSVSVTTVVSLQLERDLRLPGELQAYQDVALYARVPGFVEEISVDRGSAVKRGQLLARLKAPELDTQRSEAEARVRVAQLQRTEAAARVSSLRAQRIEAEARLASDEKTFERMKAASATPGVIAGNEVDIAARTVEAARARVRSWEESEKAAQAQVKAIEENVRALGNAASSAQSVENYLRITAPFDGVITERNVHPGSLAGPNAPAPMLRLQQVNPLRLVIAVPEGEVAGIRRGAILSFTVPAFPGETFNGSVARIGQTLEQKTRTMPVELEVANGARRLAPGMFPEVIWPSRRPRPSLFVPPGAIASTTERTFLVRVRDGVTEWIDVKRGAAMRHEGTDLIEVFGDIAPGDQVAARGTDELRAGTRVVAKPATTPKMNP